MKDKNDIISQVNLYNKGRSNLMKINVNTALASLILLFAACLCFSGCYRNDLLILTDRVGSYTYSFGKDHSEPPKDTFTVLSETKVSDPCVSETVSTTTVGIETSAGVDTGNPIVIINAPDKIEKGSKATVEIKGTPGTVYSIKVKYSSGYSSAKGLEPKTADENGLCSWTWRVSGSTKPGNYRIELSDGIHDYILTFSVE